MTGYSILIKQITGMEKIMNMIIIKIIGAIKIIFQYIELNIMKILKKVFSLFWKAWALSNITLDWSRFLHILTLHKNYDIIFIY